MFKKWFLIGFILLLTLLAFIECGESETAKGSVKSVSITINGRVQPSVYLDQGAPMPLSADVKTENGASDGVTWYVENKTQAGTGFINVNGNNATLIIDYDEYSRTENSPVLTVIARSTFDINKFAQLKVTINVKTPRLPVPSNIALNEQGVASWNPVNESGITGYSMQLYRDKPVQGGGNGDAVGGPIVVNGNLNTYDLRQIMRASGPGAYTVTLRAIGNAPPLQETPQLPQGTVFNSKLSGHSNAREVILPQITELIWKESGIAQWRNIKIAQKYELKLFKEGNPSPVHTATVNNSDLNHSEYNFAAAGVPAAAGVRYWFTIIPTLPPGTNDPLILPVEESLKSNMRSYSVLGGNINVNLEDPDSDPERVNAIVKGTISGSSIYVAVAANGRIGWSSDGRNWNYSPTAAAIFTTAGGVVRSINALAFGNGRFLAVGNEGKMASSTDGKEWKEITASWASGVNLTAAAYAFDRFFVGGAQGRIRYTDNTLGGTWSTITGSSSSVTSDNLFGVTATADRSSIRTLLPIPSTHPSGAGLVAMDTRARLARSNDGRTGWATVTGHISNAGTSSRNLRKGAVREDGFMVLVLQEGSAPYSATRGTQFVWAPHNAGTGVQTVSYGGGRFYLGSTQGRLTIYTPSIQTITGTAANPATPGGTWQAIPVGLEAGQSLFTRDETITALCVTDSGDLIMAGPGKFVLRPGQPLIVNPNYTNPTGIVSPYRNIDWGTYKQYKAGIHSHTNRSDGANTVSEMIEDHYTKGYQIYAISDHNVTNRDWTTEYRVSYGTDRPITEQRYEEITRGDGRSLGGMMRIPLSNEQSRVDHFNSYFADFNNPGSGYSLYTSIKSVQQVGGISHFNHPGREVYEISDNNFHPDAECLLRVNQSTYISRYVGHFFEFESLIGIEIVNQRDRYKFDRIIYDNILKQTMPVGRFVWAFCNDDSHALGMTGFSFNVLILPEKNLTNIRYALENGNFYGIARVLRRELGPNFSGQGIVPAITDISVNSGNLSITITASEAERIVWIADGEEIRITNLTANNKSDTLRIRDYSQNIRSYVRAYIPGKGGVAFTQPFRILYD